MFTHVPLGRLIIALVCLPALLISVHATATAVGFGIDISDISINQASVMSSGNLADFSTVDYRARTSIINTVDYCSESKCGACSLLPGGDPCQVTFRRCGIYRYEGKCASARGDSFQCACACRPLMPMQQIHRSVCCQISWEAQCLRPPYAVWAPLYQWQHPMAWRMQQPM